MRRLLDFLADDYWPVVAFVLGILIVLMTTVPNR